MEFLNKNKKQEDLFILGKICFDVLNLPLEPKEKSDEFCAIYLEGRTRDNKIEDFAVIHSFKAYSQKDYPVFVFSPDSNFVKDLAAKYKRIIHIQIPQLNSHDEYSEFMIKKFWNYLPKGFENLLFLHPDGFLIKNGWEEFAVNYDYIGSPWCHFPSIDILNGREWVNSGCEKINVGNGGFSFRKRAWCEKVSKSFSHHILRETGREDNRYPPEDLFYSHLINGKGGKVAKIKEAIKFSIDPITFKEYNDKISFGFHFPSKINNFQYIRDYYLSL